MLDELEDHIPRKSIDEPPSDVEKISEAIACLKAYAESKADEGVDWPICILGS